MHKLTPQKLQVKDLAEQPQAQKVVVIPESPEAQKEAPSFGFETPKAARVAQISAMCDLELQRFLDVNGVPGLVAVVMKDGTLLRKETL